MSSALEVTEWINVIQWQFRYLIFLHNKCDFLEIQRVTETEGLSKIVWKNQRLHLVEIEEICQTKHVCVHTIKSYILIK